MNQPGTVKSADRALNLLEVFAEHLDGLSLADVCGYTGWPKSSSLALLRTLQQRDYIEISSQTGKYRLGPRVVTLGSAYLGRLSLAREGADIVREMSQGLRRNRSSRGPAWNATCCTWPRRKVAATCGWFQWWGE